MAGFGFDMKWRRFRPPGGQAGGSAGPAAVTIAATLAGGAAMTAALMLASEQAETAALVQRMAVPPTVQRRQRIDQLIAGLKADGLWAKLDWLCLTAAHDAQAARLNWRAAKALTAVNAPVFTADRGYAGDAASAYLDTGEAVGAGGQFVTAGGTIGLWLSHQPSSTARFVMGVASGNLRIAASTVSASGRINSGSTVTAGGLPAAVARNLTVVRPNTTNVILYADGQAVLNGAAGGGTPPTANALLLSAGGGYGDQQVAAFHVGAVLTAAEVAALHARLNTYLTSIGAAA